MGHVPPTRIRLGNDAPLRPEGDFVLYWMIAARRTSWNFGLERAVEHARELGRPLLVFEPLRAGYRWASERLHRFVVEGMADNADRLARSSALYYPYLEPKHGDAKGLLAALAERACLVVTDDFPDFFLPRMVASAGRQLPIRLELVDSNGLMPLRVAERPLGTAFSFRAFVQKKLPEHLALPARDPLRALGRGPAKPPAALARHLEGIQRRWPPAPVELLAGGSLAAYAIDHAVRPVDAVHGGERAGRHALADFVDHALARYADDRNDPDLDATSGLSPYLHFGHLSAHEVFHAVMDREGWAGWKGRRRTDGSRGTFGVGAGAEAFLDQLVVWRELGYNFCAFRDDYDRYESLPEWAQRTLAEHSRDRREFVYTLEEFEAARTHDPVWNAAQRQLLLEGRLHNYLRIVWGKKILEWTADPRDALAVMIELNNKYGLDGRDPNSYSGIFWVLGRYDRPWGPERPIFGKIRYVSSRRTVEKFGLEGYLAKFGDARGGPS